MFKRGKRKQPPAAAPGNGEPPPAPAAGGKQRPASLQVNGWVVYRGTTPVAVGDTQQEAVDAAGRYLADTAGGLMHLRAVVGDELPPHPDAIEPVGRAALVRSLQRLVLAAERAGDAEAAAALGSAAARLQALLQSG